MDLADAARYPIFVAFVGEAAALSALAMRHPTEGAQQVMSVALVVLGAALLVEPLLIVAKPIDDSADELGWWPWLRISRWLPWVIDITVLLASRRIFGVL